MRFPTWFREVTAQLAALTRQVRDLEDMVNGPLEERVTELGRKVEGTRALEVPDDLDLRRLYACAVARWPEFAAHEAGHIAAPLPDGVDLRRTRPADVRVPYTGSGPVG